MDTWEWLIPIAIGSVGLMAYIYQKVYLRAILPKEPVVQHDIDLDELLRDARTLEYRVKILGALLEMDQISALLVDSEIELAQSMLDQIAHDFKIYRRKVKMDE